jgi:CRISPR/Cas system-associated exonuclease Cas4 (RecB family)
LEILELLRVRYARILEQKGLTDKAIVPQIYEINRSFIKTFDTIEIYIEGLLSRYEFEIIDKVSRITNTIIYFQTSKFTTKMLKRFSEYGIELENDISCVIDFSNKKLISYTPNIIKLNTKVISTTGRFEQIAIAFEQIEEMVIGGIEAKNIVLILPDEDLKDSIELYDKYNNLNFAMGTSYTKSRSYKALSAIETYMRDKSVTNKFRLTSFGIVLDELIEKTENQKLTIAQFFVLISELRLLDCPLDNTTLEKYHNHKVYEKYMHMSQIFISQSLYFGEWLTMWINTVSDISSDDIGGGKITVMGALETRGAVFDGVIVVDFNDGITPALPSKDMFLNSSVRSIASLPTKSDREDLQKQLYKRVLEQSKTSVVIYATSDNRLPSKFLYELGLNKYSETNGDMKILYSKRSNICDDIDPFVSDFDAKKITWSSSRLKIFLECKRKYYYQYIKRIKKTEEDINDGTILHKLFETIFEKTNLYVNENEFAKVINQTLDKLLNSELVEVKYKKLLWQKDLESFIRNQIKHFKYDWRVVEREINVSGEINGLNFTGKIDRIDQNSMETLVLDYKSGMINNKIKNLESEDDFQMSIYYYLLKSKYQNLSFGFLPIFNKEKIVGGLIEEVKSLEEKNEYLNANLEILKSTSHFSASKCEDLKKCKYCHYTLICGRGEYL